MSTSTAPVIDAQSPLRRGTSVPIAKIEAELQEAFKAGSRKHGFTWRRWRDPKAFAWTKAVLAKYDLVLTETFTHRSGTCLTCGWGCSIEDIGVLVPSSWGGLNTIDLLLRYRTCGC